jgi:hypothetical protein
MWKANRNRQAIKPLNFGSSVVNHLLSVVNTWVVSIHCCIRDEGSMRSEAAKLAGLAASLKWYRDVRSHRPV